MDFNVYRRRRLRSVQPILTRVQIKEIGAILGYSSFRKSVEFTMDPYNYFTISKGKLSEVHSYLLEKDITHLKCPSSRIGRHEHSRILINILFPGYPLMKTSDQHYRYTRENRPWGYKLIDLAYDLLPSTDKYERLDELVKMEVDWSKVERSVYSIEIPLNKIYRAIVAEGHASSKLNIRTFVYMWSSERMVFTPYCEALFIDKDDTNQFTKDDMTILKDGFKHIDITDKSTALQKATRRTNSPLKLEFKFQSADRCPNVKYISVCAVCEKSPAELTSQLYVQTSATYINRAMEINSKDLAMSDIIQKKALQLLNQYDSNDRLDVAKTERLMLDCAETFQSSWQDTKEEKEVEEDDVVIMSNEVIDMMDPVSLEKINHPARCIFCTHNTCFDASVFFQFQISSLHWQCPICSVKINGIQDLFIDYQLKKALSDHPKEDRFLRDGNEYKPIQTPIVADMPIPTVEIITVDDEIPTIKRSIDLTGPDQNADTKKAKHK
ncbi:hypothetical protein BDB01DRAFT_796081 [Pilobolus umbonatus]|nr:hypothetical protein BDB01DRAFT_796081 [Pilobolus umbonatus]